MKDLIQLEVIACDVADAVAAAEGGADRLELLSEPERGGLTPSVRMFEAVRAAVDLPLRVMLRSGDGFAIDADTLAELCGRATRLRAAGASEFVLGFLDGAGALDLDAMTALLDAARPAAWTLHHAFDNAAEPERAWRAARALPHLDLVLSAGGPSGLDASLDRLCARARWQDAGPRWLAGGGLRPDLAPRLLACGVRQFHAGRAARDGDWRRPLDAGAVRRLRAALTPRC